MMTRAAYARRQARKAMNQGAHDVFFGTLFTVGTLGFIVPLALIAAGMVWEVVARLFMLGRGFVP